MGLDPIPTSQQLADELGDLLRYGLGRTPGRVSEADVQALSDLCRDLADDPAEEWTLRIARVVGKEIDQISEAKLRLAIADIFGLELEGRSIDEVIEGIKSGEAVAPLKGHGGRYQQAAERFRGPGRKHGYSERHISETERPKWLEQVATRLLARYSESQEKEAKQTAESDPFFPDGPTGSDIDEGERRAEPPILVGIVGVSLIAVGIAWLVAIATGLIG